MTQTFSRPPCGTTRVISPTATIPPLSGPKYVICPSTKMNDALTFGVAMKSKALNCRISKGGTNKRDWIPDNHQQSKTVENPIKAQTNCAEGNNQSTRTVEVFNRVLPHQHQSPKCSCHIDSAATSRKSARKMRGPRLTGKDCCIFEIFVLSRSENRLWSNQNRPLPRRKGTNVVAAVNQTLITIKQMAIMRPLIQNSIQFL